MSRLPIDGSFGEGGGQLSRYAVALAAISGRPLYLRNIRARRAKPGLMAQHLTALRAAAEVGGGLLEGAELGATEIYYEPGRIRGGEYHFDVGTAGSIVLVLQGLLPVALHADGPVHLSITGGTDVRMAPPVDYLRLVFLPWLVRMGVRVHMESLRHGYYPKGGGLVQLQVEPCSSPRPLLAEAPGALQRISGVSHVAHLPLHIPERMAAAASAVLADFDAVQIETRVLGDTEAFGTGGAIVLTAETENSVLGAATVAERGVPAERLGEDVGHSLRAELNAGAAIDIHACDQLLIYAAQARGISRFAVRKVTEHTRTVIWLVEQFLPVRFSVEPWQGLYRIEVSPG
ncbi:RNA 3'-terminal phosphate cyclase [Microbulbifer sp.]|uniref:RNA 3'-terminal phosphate cyclase n=1 Tax=Microbulbifer sp. TaxID=1908541 RepID=UPI003F3DAE6F